MTDPRGNVRRVTFNALGYIATDTYASGTTLAQAVTYERNATSGLRSAAVDNLGRRFEHVRNSNGSITQLKGLVGTANLYTVSAAYTTAFDQIATSTDPRGKVTTFTYDTLGRMTRITNPLNHANSFTYNTGGQVLTAKDGLNKGCAKPHRHLLYRFLRAGDDCN